MTRRTAGFVVAGLVVALALAAGASRYASSEPDGLERVAADHGLDAGEQPHALAGGSLAEYTATGIGDGGMATGIAGAAGVAATFAAGTALVWLASRLTRRSSPTDDPPADP